ncbi:MAG: stage II sporulation protein R [Ruminococcus sp.]|nr:stage II sporulation protein R [Ruminococcus sp.]
MKLFIKSLCAAMAVCLLFSIIPFSAECSDISTEVFRLHILANSDSKADQNLKLKVRDKVLEYTESLYKSADSLIKAETLTNDNLQTIADVAAREVKRSGYSYPVKAEIKRMYFNTRHYGKITMPSGMYNALRITIGKGEGHNWWCVMYPSMCVGVSTDYDALKSKTTDNQYRIMTDEGYELKFKIVEYFVKISSLFS